MARPKTGPTPFHHVSDNGVVTWRVRFRMTGAKYATTKTFNDQKSANTFAGMLKDFGPEESIAILEEWSKVGVGAVTVAQWCADHIESISGVQEDTRKRYRAYVRRDLGKIGKLPLAALTPEAVAAWVNALEKAGASAKTIKNKHGFLAGAMQHAVMAKEIPSSPCEFTRLPRSISPPMVFLTHDEYARFLGFITPYWRPLVTTLFSTGLRWGEATALQVGDFDAEAATVTVSRAWKEGGVLGPPKSEKSRRTISLAVETVAILEALVKDRPADAWIFLNHDGNPVRSPTFHDNVWKPAVRLANGEEAASGKRIAKRLDEAGKVIAPAKVPLGKRPRPHDARHSCASWLLGQGVPINYVQAHLGHESITTTVDRYGHVMPAARQAISHALSMALTQAHPQIES